MLVIDKGQSYIFGCIRVKATGGLVTLKPQAKYSTILFCGQQLFRTMILFQVFLCLVVKRRNAADSRRLRLQQCRCRSGSAHRKFCVEALEALQLSNKSISNPTNLIPHDFLSTP